MENPAFALNIRMMKLLGLYPTEKHTLLVSMQARAFFVLFLVLMDCLTLVKFVAQRANDVLEMNFTVIYMIAATTICLKFVLFSKNRRRIKGCINYFVSSKFEPRDDTEKGIVADGERLCRRMSRAYIYLIISTTVLWIIPLLMNHELPLDFWLPFQLTPDGNQYYLIFFYIYSTFVYGGSIEIVVPLIGGLAYQATAQMKILKYRLQNFNRFLNSKSLLYEQLKSCVDRHNNILDFVAEYEECFSTIIFCQFAGSMFSICFCCIGFTVIRPGTLNFAKCLATCIICNLQIFFYCHYGSLLFEESDRFIDAVYTAPWYKYDVEIRKTLIVMMERSKRPMIISAGKVIDVTLQTFARVLKTSYSLIAVFNKY